MGKKLLMLLGAFLVIYLLNFSIPRLMPGDPFDYTSGAAGDDVDAAYSEEQKELLRQFDGTVSKNVTPKRKGFQDILNDFFK